MLDSPMLADGQVVGTGDVRGRIRRAVAATGHDCGQKDRCYEFAHEVSGNK